MQLVRRLLARLGSLLALVVPLGAGAALEIDDPALRLERHQLDNGLTVLLLEDRATPVVSFQVWVKAGGALTYGVRLNNGTFRQGPSQYLATVDPQTIQQIEVVRGAASSLYGSDAIGGVVNVLTRRAANFLGTGQSSAFDGVLDVGRRRRSGRDLEFQAVPVERIVARRDDKRPRVIVLGHREGRDRSRDRPTENHLNTGLHECFTDLYRGCLGL